MCTVRNSESFKIVALISSFSFLLIVFSHDLLFFRAHVLERKFFFFSRSASRGIPKNEKNEENAVFSSFERVETFLGENSSNSGAFFVKASKKRKTFTKMF